MMIVFVRSPKANEPVEFSLPGILKFYLVRPKLTIAKPSFVRQLADYGRVKED